MSIKSVANVGRSILPIVVGSYAGNYAKGLFGGSEFAGGVGWFLGQAGLNAILPKQKVQQQGSRLSDLSVQSSSYGTTIPLIFGRVKVAGAFVWARPLEEYTKVSTTSDGKGGSGVKTETTEYKYRANFAIYLGEGPNEMVHRIWANGTLIFEDGKYMPTNTTTALNLNGTMPDEGVDIAPNIRLYFGTETQLPDPIIESYEGIGEVPAHRGLTYLRFTDFELEPYGNSMPAFEFELSNYVAVEEPEVIEADGVPNGGRLLKYDYDETTGILAMAVSPADWPVVYDSSLRSNLYVQRNTDTGLKIEAVELPDITSLYGVDMLLVALQGYAYLIFQDGGMGSASSYIQVKLSEDGAHSVVAARLPNGFSTGPYLSHTDGTLPYSMQDLGRQHANIPPDKAAVAKLNVYYYDDTGTRGYKPSNLRFNWLEHDNPTEAYQELTGPTLTTPDGRFDGLDHYNTLDNMFSVATSIRPVVWTEHGDALGGWYVCQAGFRTDIDAMGVPVQTWIGNLYSFDAEGLLTAQQSFSPPAELTPGVSPTPFIDPQRKAIVLMGAVIQLWDL